MTPKESLKLVAIKEICLVEKGQSITSKNVVPGKIPVIAGGQQPAYYHSKANQFGKTITVSASGAYAGFVNYFEVPIFASDCTVIKAKSNEVSIKYVYYALRAQQRIIYQFQRGAGQPHVYPSDLREIKIPLPPLSAQDGTVRTLDRIEEARALRVQSDRLTASFLKSIFLEMFGNPLLNPMGWPMKRITEFGRVMTGNTPSRRIVAYYGDYIDWIKSDNLNTPFTFTTRAEEGLSEKGAQVGRIAPKGSVLVTCIAGSLSSIGNAAIADRDVAFNQQINAVIPNRDVDTFFLYHLLVLSKKLIQDSSTHSMKGMISKSTFEDIELISPPFELQKHFGAVARIHEAAVGNQTASKVAINSLFNAILAESLGRWN